MRCTAHGSGGTRRCGRSKRGTRAVVPALALASLAFAGAPLVGAHASELARGTGESENPAASVLLDIEGEAQAPEVPCATGLSCDLASGAISPELAEGLGEAAEAPVDSGVVEATDDVEETPPVEASPVCDAVPDPSATEFLDATDDESASESASLATSPAAGIVDATSLVDDAPGGAVDTGDAVAAGNAMEPGAPIEEDSADSAGNPIVDEAGDSAIGDSAEEPRDPAAIEDGDDAAANALAAEDAAADAPDVSAVEDVTAADAPEIDALLGLDATDGEHEAGQDEQAVSLSETKDKKSGWVTENGMTCFYDKDGKKLVGEANIDDSWYYFDAKSGAMVTGLTDITTSSGTSKTVYYDASGRMCYGERNISSFWYFFDTFDGTMARGITDMVTTSGAAKTAYYDDDGRMQYGEQNLNDSWYYFSDFDGAMARGVTDIPTSMGSSKTVYYDQVDGTMQYGEVNANNSWYFFDTFDGHMVTGWTYLSNPSKWVYYGSDGRMRYGEQWIDGDRYFFNTFDGSSEFAQVLRWRLNHASGSGSLALFGGAQASSASMTQLAQAIGSFTGQGLSVGFVMMDINTGKGISSNADASFYSASTVKGPYVASLYDKVFGDSTSASAPWYQTLNDACVWSDNDAYYTLRRAFGSEAFASWLYEAGVDAGKASTNYTRFTPRELGKLWLRMYDYFGSAGAAGQQMSGLFSHSYYSSIYNELGGQYEVRSKPGWYPYDPGYTATNDAGIVYAGGGPYLVVVLSDAPVRLDLTQTLVRALDAVHASIVS